MIKSLEIKKIPQNIANTHKHLYMLFHSELLLYFFSPKHNSTSTSQLIQIDTQTKTDTWTCTFMDASRLATQGLNLISVPGQTTKLVVYWCYSTAQQNQFSGDGEIKGQNPACLWFHSLRLSIKCFIGNHLVLKVMFLRGSWHDDSSCWTDNTTSPQTTANYLHLHKETARSSN